MRAIFICFSLTFGSLLAGAAAAQQSPKHETSSRYLKTPVGDVRVYDASLDENFIAAVTRIYERGDVTFGDVTGSIPFHFSAGHPDNDDVQYVRRARAVQRLDISRAGCRYYIQAPCGGVYTPVFKTRCADSEFGSPNYSSCESKFRTGEIMMLTRTHIIDPWETQKYKFLPKTSKVEWVKNSDYPEQYERKIIESEERTNTTPCLTRTCQIDTLEVHIDVHHLIGEASGYSLADTIRLLSHISCSKWHDDDWFE